MRLTRIGLIGRARTFADVTVAGMMCGELIDCPPADEGRAPAAGKAAPVTGTAAATDMATAAIRVAEAAGTRNRINQGFTLRPARRAQDAYLWTTRSLDIPLWTPPAQRTDTPVKSHKSSEKGSS